MTCPAFHGPMETHVNILQQAPHFFSTSYAEARAKFRAACGGEGLDIMEYRHPLPGPAGEVLATDVALLGAPSARKLLIVISGTHGVEGLAGSGGQIGWLRTDLRRPLPADTAILFVHLINPWGCAWQRRQTEDNVDLNRNFQAFDGPLPENPLYSLVHPLIVDSASGERAESDPAIVRFRAEKGEEALANALFSGQYEHSDGVGFGGDHAGWSHRTLAQILADHASAADHVAVIDIHTGLGSFGHGLLLCLEEAGSPALRRARAWFGPGVLSPREADEVPYALEGNMLDWIGRTLAAETTMVAIEFGTFELARMLDLQIDDCRVQKAGARATAFGATVRDELQKHFYPETPDWLQSVLLRVAQVIDLALNGLEDVEVNEDA